MMKEERKPKSFCVSLWVRVFLVVGLGLFPSPRNRTTKLSSLNPKQGKQHLIITTHKKRAKSNTNLLYKCTCIYVYFHLLEDKN